MINKIKINIKNNINIRIDKYLYIFFKKKISRKKIQNNIINNNVLLNNKIIKCNKKIKINDKIIFIYNNQLLNNNNNIITENKNIKINIHYEDKYIIIINKQPGLIVHPGYGNYNNTLINWLKYYINIKNINNNLNYTDNKLGLLHRLDKNTSGLLIIAKNLKIYNNIKKQFINKIIIKKYLALVWGIPKYNTLTIKNYIGRNIKNRKIMKVYLNKKYGKYSITKYKIIKKFKYFSLLKCYLKTGRTHQIRIHLNYIGNTIFNDDIYGGNKIKNNLNFNKINKNILNKCFKILPRLALHAYYLKFYHPIFKKNKKFIIKLPNDIKKLIKFIIINKL
ncbi:MAG: hypothetical protein RDO_1480 [Flavobacteriales endosymbiont of Rhyzopertha dominica]|nr:MAG: RluA family pseudouridine synthase [Candidatus Shikimatogenerans bostrichidophilus]